MLWRVVLSFVFLGRVLLFDTLWNEFKGWDMYWGETVIGVALRVILMSGVVARNVIFVV